MLGILEDTGDKAVNETKVSAVMVRIVLRAGLMLDAVGDMEMHCSKPSLRQDMLHTAQFCNCGYMPVLGID